jgi:GNAT superfamily N-acetyltransferase
VSAPVIRDAVESDLEDIYRLARALAVFEDLEASFVAEPEQYRAAIFGPEAVAEVLIAELEDQVAGFALCFRTFSTFLGRPGIWLEDLYVDERFRRRGVARSLLVELVRRSPGRVEWEVLDWNADAIELYDSIGASPFSGWIKYRLSPQD